MSYIVSIHRVLAFFVIFFPISSLAIFSIRMYWVLMVIAEVVTIYFCTPYDCCLIFSGGWIRTRSSYSYFCIYTPDLC